MIITDGNDLVKQFVSQVCETLKDVEGDSPNDCTSIGKALGMLTVVLGILSKEKEKEDDQ